MTVMLSTNAYGAVIRPYERSDRSAVREICFETADRGRPMAVLCPDREAVADLLTRYYTDWEPWSTWVACIDGQVIGYLTGSLNTRRYQRVMRTWIVPEVLGQALLRGALLHRSTWQLVRAAWMTWQQGGFRRLHPPQGYPAHFHLNIRERFRGAQVGHKLVERFCAHTEAAHVPGIHLSAREDNINACRFFERLDFRSVGRYPVVLPEEGSYRMHYTVVYAKPL